ncbi:MAG: phosphate/phosphite/phosphonate ABC transporter substrate-binding protein [Thermodesulfovibrionia bacterium]
MKWLFASAILIISIISPSNILHGQDIEKRTIRVGVASMITPVTEFNSLRKNINGGMKSISLAVIPRDNPRIAYEKYQPLIDYLNEVTGLKIELILKKSYEETIEGLGNGEIDIALLTPLPYLEAHAHHGAISLLKHLTDRSEPFYRSAIITRKESPIENLSQLKGKSFAFASTMSTSGNLIPRYMLAEAGIHLKDLREYKNFDYHDTVVKWVLKGKYDAGAVRETVAKKYAPFGLKMIALSEPIPTGPLVVRKGVSPKVMNLIKDAFLRLSISDKGKKILKMLDPDLMGGFIEAHDSDYEGIRKKINDVPNTCGKGCHPKIKL